MIPGIVYLLSAATSLLCTVMLYRAYRRTGVRLLFWSALCFAGLVLDNFILFADVYIFPDISMEIWRKLPGLVALVLLLFGLIWESE